MLDLGVGGLRSVFSRGAESSGLTSVDQGFHGAGVPGKQDLTASCTRDVADHKASNRLCVLRLKHEHSFGHPQRLALAGHEFVNLNGTVLAHQDATGWLIVLQLGNFDVRDWSFGAFVTGIQLPKHNQLVSLQLYSANVSVLEAKQENGWALRLSGFLHKCDAGWCSIKDALGEESARVVNNFDRGIVASQNDVRFDLASPREIAVVDDHLIDLVVANEEVFVSDSVVL